MAPRADRQLGRHPRAGRWIGQSAKDAAVDWERTVVAAPGQDCGVSGTLGEAVLSNASGGKDPDFWRACDEAEDW